MVKGNYPCYFYNTGGCYDAKGVPKPAAKCKFAHIKVRGVMSKPQHLKPPCKYYHLNKKCTNSYCIYGHTELTRHRWRQFFREKYPGPGYTQSYTWYKIRVCSTPQKFLDYYYYIYLVALLQLLNINNKKID